MMILGFSFPLWEFPVPNCVYVQWKLWDSRFPLDLLFSIPLSFLFSNGLILGTPFVGSSGICFYCILFSNFARKRWPNLMLLLFSKTKLSLKWQSISCTVVSLEIDRYCLLKTIATLLDSSEISEFSHILELAVFMLGEPTYLSAGVSSGSCCCVCCLQELHHGMVQWKAWMPALPNSHNSLKFSLHISCWLLTPIGPQCNLEKKKIQFCIRGNWGKMSMDTSHQMREANHHFKGRVISKMCKLEQALTWSNSRSMLMALRQKLHLQSDRQKVMDDDCLHKFHKNVDSFACTGKNSVLQS